MSAGLRVALLGATGALGTELLAELEASSLPVAELVPVATDRSLGSEVEFRGASLPVETELPPLRGFDLVFLAGPAPACLETAREALRAGVPCIDAAGALAGSPEVPLRVAAFSGPSPPEPAPLVVSPPGPALAWALLLRPLEAAAGLRRVVGTALEAASRGGRDGIEALYRESIALFNQAEAPAPEVFGRPVAFDCLPTLGVLEEGGATDRESAVVRALGRLLAGEPRLALTEVQVPAFVGWAATAAVELERALDPKEACAALAKAGGVEPWPGEAGDLTMRVAAGRPEVLVGRVRHDPSREGSLLLWLVADMPRLSAANAVQLAVTRFQLHH